MQNLFVDCYWPDFNGERFAEAIAEYTNRQRRFEAYYETKVDYSNRNTIDNSSIITGWWYLF